MRSTSLGPRQQPRPRPRPRRTCALAAAAWLAFGASGCAAPPALGTDPASAAVALDELIALDPDIRTGTLANGLTYYIQAHPMPKKRAQLWLAVRAGSALEDEDQRGLAHFVEHMGFNGTRRFPKHALVDLLERTGVQFGPDLNASTTLDATTYKLQIPTDEPQLVATGLEILRDWAGEISFGAAEIEAERGVVLEEWRRARGARARLRDRSLPVLLHGSPLADRLPIGRPEIIRDAPRDVLVRFYRDWYRPEQMAVIAVGDVSPADLERQIAAEFSGLRPPGPARTRFDTPLPAHAETLVSIETDPEVSATSVAIYTKLPQRSHSSVGDFRRRLAEDLHHRMLNARYEERRREADAGFLRASSWTGGLVHGTDVWIRRATVTPDGVEAGLVALLEESQRVERFGFMAAELERAKRSVMQRYERAAARHSVRNSGGLAASIARHFYEQRALPGSEAELELAKRLLPELDLAALQELVRTSLAGSRVLVVEAPAEAKLPTSASLLAVASRSARADLEPYREGEASELTLALPAAGAVTHTHTLAELGVTEWRLANGVRIVVKPTDFGRDEVEMLAFSPGGHSLAASEDFDSARLADLVVEDAGVGALDPPALRRVLAGRTISLHARITELEERVTGSSAPRDLEDLLRLTHLAFTAPRRDQAAFQIWRRRQIEDVRNRRAVPEQVFVEEMERVLTQGHPRRGPVTAESLERIDLDRALAFYRDRFGDASDFVFVFVGNVDPEMLRPLAERYLGSLPAQGRVERWRDLGIREPARAYPRIIFRGQEPKSRVMISFQGAHTWSRSAEREMRVLVEALRLRLREVLREELSGVYGVGVDGWLRRWPDESFRVVIGFGCAPANVEALRDAVRREIAALRQHGVDEAHLAKIRTARARGHEVDLERNGFWLYGLARAYRFGEDPAQLLDIQAELAEMSSEQVRAAAQTYLDLDRSILGILLPDAEVAEVSLPRER